MMNTNKGITMRRRIPNRLLPQGYGYKYTVASEDRMIPDMIGYYVTQMSYVSLGG